MLAGCARPMLMGVLVLFTLSACSSGGRVVRPADIPAVQFVRNSPKPIPLPRAKPTPPSRYGDAAPQVRVQSAAPSGSHVVAKGETLFAISRRYDVPVRDLITRNALKAPYTLAIGQKLEVPGAQIHRVAKGETGYGISRQYGVTVSALMRENNIKPPYQLEVGQVLKLPGGASADAPTSAQVASNRPVVTTRPQSPGRTVPKATPPPRTSSGFDWPVDGKLASRFGPKDDGLHNDGINILAGQGTPVKAAEAGVVVYASNALQGYGNMLLLKHDGGWITAYAHNERLLVRQGQTVDKGQVIARVGNTGGVSDPQLHFEIRKGRQALDPLQYLRRMSASAD